MKTLKFKFASTNWCSGAVTAAVAVCVLVPMAPNSAAAQGFPIATPKSQGLDPKLVDKLDQTVQRYVDEQSIVGGELLVIKNRKTVLHKAYGFQDKEAGKKMQIGTIFNIRSMTKALTGAAMQTLIEEGKVGLDEPVSKYLSEFDIEGAKTITVRQLLTHRSGLPLTVVAGLNQYKSLQEIAAAAAKSKKQFEPGREFFYSDAGSDCVAAIIERVSGVPVDQFVTKRLLRPLGMNDSFYVWDESKKGRIASLYAGKRGAWSRLWDAQKQFYPFAWGSQTLYSTADDYAKFLAMWIDDGKAGGKQILSKATLDRAHAPISEMFTLGGGSRMPTGFFDLTTYYGELAQLWFATPLKPGDKPVVIGHSGSDGTMAWTWPKEDLIVCFFTQSRGMSGSLRIETVIDATLRGKDTVPTPAALKPYIGTYLANFGSFNNEEFVIQFVNGKFALELESQLTFVLDGPDKDGRWGIHGAPGQTLSFSKPVNGKSASMFLHVGENQIELPRGKAVAVKSVPIKLEDVQKFLGKYSVPEDNSTVEIKYLDGSLMIHIESAGLDLPLLPVQGNPNVWLLNGTVPVEFEIVDGKVTAFTATMPGGNKVRRARIEKN